MLRDAIAILIQEIPVSTEERIELEQELKAAVFEISLADIANSLDKTERQLVTTYLNGTVDDPTALAALFTTEDRQQAFRSALIKVTDDLLNGTDLIPAERQPSVVENVVTYLDQLAILG